MRVPLLKTTEANSSVEAVPIAPTLTVPVPPSKVRVLRFDVAASMEAVESVPLEVVIVKFVPEESWMTPFAKEMGLPFVVNEVGAPAFMKKFEGDE
jgi:hypothetical protein